jgi:hypothetical protein
LGLGDDGQITFVNVGFNNPAVRYSRVWQGPGWTWVPPRFPGSDNGLPPKFPELEITQNRIKLETAGELKGIRWKAKIDVPLWNKGL